MNRTKLQDPDLPYLTSLPFLCTLTVMATKTINTNNGGIDITSWDIDLVGSLNSGTQSTLIHSSKSAQSIMLGNFGNKDMTIKPDELQRITASGLTVGGPQPSTLISQAVTPKAPPLSTKLCHWWYQKMAQPRISTKLHQRSRP